MVDDSLSPVLRIVSPGRPPPRCEIGFTQTYNTQIMHQPAWSLCDVAVVDGRRVSSHTDGD